MASLSTSHQDVVRDFIEYGKSEFGFSTHKALVISLVLTGERDGCLIGVSDSNRADKLKEILGDSVPYEYNKSRSDHQFYIGKSEKHINKYKPASAGARKIGKFFGYPDSAIDFYVNNYDRTEQYEDFLESDDSPITPAEESDKLFLIEYIPEPSESGIQEALDRQKRYETVLNSLSVKLSDANNFGVR